jgi:hypothetical protein
VISAQTIERVRKGVTAALRDRKANVRQIDA